MSRQTTPTGQIISEMSFEGQPFFVVDENPQAFNLSPKSLNGTSVRVSLVVDDRDALTARALAAGATSVSRSHARSSATSATAPEAA